MRITQSILLALLLFMSCSTQNRLDRKCRKAKVKYEVESAKWGCPTVRDSISVHSQVIIRDTTIYVQVPGQTNNDSVQVIITQGIMNSPVSILETSYALSKAWVEEGLLRHQLDQKQNTIPVIIPGAIHTSTSATVQTIQVPHFIVRPTPKPLLWWQSLFIWTGVFVWGSALGYLIFKSLRFSIL